MFTSTVFSQIISTDELNQRIKNDFVTYSWEQANEFVNGLENEAQLWESYKLLSKENNALLNSYIASEARNKNYEEDIVPALESIIKTKDANFTDLNNVYKSSETLLKKQRRKKWLWFLIGAGAGVTTYAILK